MDLIKSTQTQNTLFNKLTEKNLERMRGQSKFGKADSEKEMEKVARDFESVRKAIPKSGILDSSALDMYQSMMDQEMAKNMSERKGMGLGEMVYKDLSRLDKVFRGESISSSSIKMPIIHKTENTLGK